MTRESRRNRIGPRVVIIETIWALLVYGMSLLMRSDEGCSSMSLPAAISIWWSFLVLSQLIAEWMDRERGAWEYLFLTFADRIRKPILTIWLTVLVLAGAQGLQNFSLLLLQTILSCWAILGRRSRLRMIVETLGSLLIRYLAFVFADAPDW